MTPPPPPRRAQVYFGREGVITGGSVRTYLLEKSRVVAQGTDETNYHIFYRLVLGAESPFREQLSLLPSSQYVHRGTSSPPPGMC